MIRAGFGKADITPEPGLPLSGFAYRENSPSTHIDDPLHARALLIKDREQYFCFISLEILGVGPELQKLIINHLQHLPVQLDEQNIVVTAVHNHSAPITISLAGEADPDKNYLGLIAARTLRAVEAALTDLQIADGFIVQRKITDLTYNRRAVLDDGRVSMAIQPDGKVVERGPVDDILTVIAIKNQQGQVKGTIAHFPCHGVAVCTSGITHDIPGRISRELEDIFSAPCLYFQGGAGDINPTIVSTSHGQLNHWTVLFRNQIEDLPTQLKPLNLDSVVMHSQTVPVPLRPLPEHGELLHNIQKYQQIATGDLDSPDLGAAIQNIANIINLPPGVKPELNKAIYFANALIKSNQRILELLDKNEFSAKVPTDVTFFRLGEIRMAFIGAEIFASAGLEVRQMVPDSINLLVTYSGPVIGYIPDDRSMKRGGYEANDAWMFYLQPAPFALGAVDQLLAILKTGLLTL